MQGVFCKTKTFTEMYEAELEFPDRWEKILSVGEACKFSVTRQLRLLTVTVL